MRTLNTKDILAVAILSPLIGICEAKIGRKIVQSIKDRKAYKEALEEAEILSEAFNAAKERRQK